MAISEELRELVSSLGQSEKRMIRLLGMAKAGEAGSQQMDLWDWMRQHPGESEVPEGLGFSRNLPIVTARLKAHILDTLRTLHKDDDVDARLRTGLDEAALLMQRRLFPSALRQLRRMRQDAGVACRHASALQTLLMEQHIVRTQGGKEMMEKLRQLRAEEMAMLSSLAEAREVRHRLDQVLAKVRQHFLPRSQETYTEITALGQGEMVRQLAATGGYVDRAMAVHLLALAHFYNHDPEAAMNLCEELLREWSAHPEWQADQAQLLLQVCRTYQNACFMAIADPDLLAQKTALMPAFEGLDHAASLDYQRLLHQNQLALALNTGNLEVAERLIPEIDAWLSRKGNQALVRHQLSFYHNFAIAHFLSGHHADANRQVLKILHHSERHARQDVRDFARVLQAVLQFELGDTQLSDYLARSAKRHFGQRGPQVEFEMAVLTHLQQLMGLVEQADVRQARQQFIHDLERIAAGRTGEVLLLGLNEILQWAKARLRGVTIREVFLEAVMENLGR